ncbi:ankyrin repeat-containing domain protein [Echria macrotheca]|uniref:Ankyrin repeat-containing domain protein n=1 Tax=Echria macrotheca TaxID=438768 RepID=A0AAJ0FA12_9PEZI|nr:ankyrin repeat-containing domain protein [Echria macrotheca]
MEQTLDCPDCFKRCKTAGALEKHRNRHTKPFRCLDEKCRNKTPPVCFGMRSKLKAHQRCHTKAFQCSNIDCRQRNPLLRFATRRDLTRHQQTHEASDSPVLMCHYCGDTTGRRDNLQRHIETVHKGGVCKAAKNGDEETMRQCLRANPQAIQETDQDGHTPFLLSCIHGQERILQMLLDEGAGTDPDTGLYALWLAVLHDKPKIIKLLVGAGFTKASWKQTYKSKTLIQAATDGDLPLVKRYTDIGGDIEIMDTQGRSALVHAAEKGYEDIVKHLIDRGAKLELTKVYRQPIPSVCLVAARCGHVGILDFLLSKEPEFGFDSRSIYDAIFEDDQSQHEGILRLIAKRVVHHDELSDRLANISIYSGNTMGARILFEERSTTHPIPNEVSTIFLVARWCRSDLVLFLLEQGVPIGSVLDGQSLLHYVASTPRYYSLPVDLQIHVLRVLLDRGLETEALDSSGYNALHWATKRGHLEVVKFLLEAGANPHTKTRDNLVAVDLIPQRLGEEGAARFREQLLLDRAGTLT